MLTNLSEQMIESFKKTFAYIELDPNGIIMDANEAYCHLLGFSPSELIGEHHRVTAPPDVAQSDSYKNFLLDLKNGLHFLREAKRVNRKNKNLVYFTASYNPIKNADGIVSKIIILAIDTTLAKLNEEKVARISMMIEKSSTNTLMISPTGNLEYINLASFNSFQKLGIELPDNVDELLNKSISWFIQDSSLLALFNDPSHFPIVKKIILHSDVIELSISAINDNQNIFLGVMVNWNLISNKEKLIKNLEDASLELSHSSKDGLQLSKKLNTAIEDVFSQSSSVNNSTNVLNLEISQLSKSMHELVNSMQGITQISADSMVLSNEAILLTKNTEKTISELRRSIDKVGDVTKLINTISQQTNLLALNATIEAARAGENGKGFAVVANEVKELSKQTARATEEIDKTIQDIQCKAIASTKSIDEISKTINSLNNFSNTISSSVNLQSKTTQEINRVVISADQGVDRISKNILQISNSIKSVEKEAMQVKESSNELDLLSKKLHEYVNHLN